MFLNYKYIRLQKINFYPPTVSHPISLILLFYSACSLHSNTLQFRHFNPPTVTRSTVLPPTVCETPFHLGRLTAPCSFLFVSSLAHCQPAGSCIYPLTDFLFCCNHNAPYSQSLLKHQLFLAQVRFLLNRLLDW